MRAGSLIAGLSALFAAGCQPPVRADDPFTASGEMIAVSGGDAGARGACITCHGLGGEGDGELVPRLAGLPAGYLQKQLRDYAAGLRPHASMQVIAKALTEEDRRKVARYYAGLDPAPGAGPRAVAAPQAAGLYHRGDPARGLVPCAACHGPAGEGAGQANPPLAGQPAGYLAVQLAEWRAAKRRNDPNGVMLHAARPLTDAEIAGLAAYAATLGPASARSGAPPAASR